MKKLDRKNILTITCNISGQLIEPSEAICVNTQKNNTTYISKNYYNYFTSATDKSLQLDLLTMVTYNDCKLVVNNNIIQKELTTDLPVIAVAFDNDIQLYLYQHKNNLTDKVSNSNLCGFMNLLKQHKQEIKTITLVDTISKSVTDITNQSLIDNIIPTYTLIDYYHKKYNLYYNPTSKKSLVKIW